jgi:hypothetical protein
VSYALKETLSSKRQGRDLWFCRMTAIGPMTTADPSERKLWASADDALRSPAALFPLTFFEPVFVAEDGRGAA